MSSDELMLEPARPHRLAETVAQRILVLVRERETGERLPSVRSLAEGYDVSQSTVREALQSLAAVGVVDIRHGRGIFVKRRGPIADPGGSVAEYGREEILEARRVIEVELARFAAKRRTEAQLAELKAILDDHAQHLADGRPPIVHTSRFHLLLHEAAASRVLADAVQPFFRTMIERGPNFYEQVEGFAEWELEEHRALLEPIEAGDGVAAAERMLTHIDAMERYYRSVPDVKPG